MNTMVSMKIILRLHSPDSSFRSHRPEAVSLREDEYIQLAGQGKFPDPPVITSRRGDARIAPTIYG